MEMFAGYRGQGMLGKMFKNRDFIVHILHEGLNLKIHNDNSLTEINVDVPGLMYCSCSV